MRKISRKHKLHLVNFVGYKNFLQRKSLNSVNSLNQKQQEQITSRQSSSNREMSDNVEHTQQHPSEDTEEEEEDTQPEDQKHHIALEQQLMHPVNAIPQNEIPQASDWTGHSPIKNLPVNAVPSPLILKSPQGGIVQPTGREWTVEYSNPEKISVSSVQFSIR
jgi:hypothetical protein